MKKKIFFSVLSMMLAAAPVLHAEDFTKGDFTYKVLSSTDKTCQVTQSVTNTDTLTVPETVDNNGIQYTVVSIGKAAFDGATSMAVLNLPSTLLSIDNGAFFKCSKLRHVYTKAVTPPDIEASPFATTTYTNATLYVPDGTWFPYQLNWRRFYKIQEAGAYTEKIDGINYLMVSPTSHYAAVAGTSPKYSGDVVIPSKVISRGQEYTVVSIGGSAFSGCSDLTSIQLPDSLLAIVQSGFQKCKRLKTVVMPPTMRVLSQGAFNSCDSLETVTFPMGLKRIENIVFEKCINLKEVTLPDSLIYIGPSSFSGCTSLTTIHGGGNIRKLMSAVFNNCSSLINFSMPPAIEHIDGLVFCNTKIDFPAPFPPTLQYIGSQAFKGNTAIKHVVIPNGCTISGSNLFNGCTGLETIVLPDSCHASTKGWTAMFRDCKALKTVKLPVDMDGIPNNFLSNCSSLAEIDLPESLITFGNWCFSGTTSLHKFKFPSQVTALPLATFQESGLDSVVLPANITLLGNQVFRSCPNLKSVKIMGPVTSIGAYVFSKCPELTEVILNDGLQTLGRQAFAESIKLKTVELPASITTFYQEIFMGCTGLDTITIPAGMTKILPSTFKDCSSLRSITFPATVDTIEATAFAGCTALTNVYAHRIVPPVLDPTAFDDATYTNANLYATAEGLAAYRNAEGWRKFTHLYSGVDEIIDNEEPVYGSFGAIIAPADARIYNMQGVRCRNEMLPSGTYIVITGNGKTYKVFVR